MPLHPDDNDLPRLVWHPPPNFSDSELRETGYELLSFACWFSRSAVKKLLRLKTVSSLRSEGEEGGGTGSAMSQKPAGPILELIREQMRIPEEIELRLEEPLRKIAHDLHGSCMASIVLPLELIERYSESDFPSQQEYETCLRRNFKVLEAGLLLHPHLPLDKSGTPERRVRMRKHGMRLQRMIDMALENPIVFQCDSESMQSFRTTVMCLASRSSDGSASETCHWADGYPLNLQIYQNLLGACFDIHEETYVTEDVDAVLKLIETTWVMLGINDMLHNICFSWVLFHRYVSTGQVENGLLHASCNRLARVENDTSAVKDPLYSKALNSALSLILRWADKRLLAYHDAFREGKMESLEDIISLAVLSAEILAECNAKRKEAEEAGTKAKQCIRSYIRSSLGCAFAQILEKHNPSKHPSREQNGAFPTLSVLAQDITELAFNEKEMFSPKLKRWHPLATGVAAATLHKLYGEELKKHVERITELTSDATKVLLAADKLEKDLAQIAAEDSFDSEDGGKSVIREIQPYGAGALLTKLVESWIKIRVDGFGEILQPEVWNLRANEEGFVPSVVEVVKVIADYLKECFSLPIPMYALLLPDLISGLDKSLRQCILKATFGYGNRNTFVPAKPALTRSSVGSKSHFAFQKKEKLKSSPRKKAQVGTTSEDNSFDAPQSKARVGTPSANNSFDIPQLCVRINALWEIGLNLGVLNKWILDKLSSSESSRVSLKFELSSAAALEGIHQLCECIAYKVIFQDLRHVLWDGLYVGEVSATRIGPFLQELKKYLKIIISITPVRDKVKTRVTTEVMQASFDGFLLVLLAGGPSRAFSLQDSTILEEDFKSLTDLFWSNGEGLPAELIEEHSTTVRAVLPLFRTETECLIQQLTQLTQDMHGPSVKSRLPLPPASDQWSPREPDTLLRVLCYRNDRKASEFLKKMYSLPKNV